jgi:glycosyltransferase involved in cell wall biosynthesis
VRVALDVSAIPARPAGAGVYVQELTRALDASGLDLSLVTGRDDGLRWQRLAPSAGIVEAVPRNRPARLAWEQALGASLARRMGADLWHGPHYTLPARLDLPGVVTLHDTTFFDHPEWHERSKVAFFQRMIRVAVHRAQVLISVSEQTTRRVQEILNPTAPLLTIPHGVDHARFHPGGPGQEEADLAALAALGVKPPFVVFQGTIEPRKDVPTLVRAFAPLAAGRPDVQLVLAGIEGWGTAEVDTAVRRTKLGDRVVRLGWVDAEVVPALFRRAEVVAYPSLEEGFGLPALEALACGAVLVTTRGTAMADVAAGAAVLIDPGDEAALADVLATLLDDADARAALRAAGPAIAAPYTWAACAARHVEAYRLALGA